MTESLLFDPDLRDDYHSDTTRVSKSGLDKIHQSPLHYWARYLDPNRLPETKTPALIMGSLTNDMLLQEHLLHKQYVIEPAAAPNRPSRRQINAAKPSPETLQAIEFWKEWDRLNGEKTVVTQEQWDKARWIRDAVLNHKAARLLLKQGVAEKTVLFDEPETGVACKCRPDWFSHNADMLVDLKTTSDASPEAFGRSAASYRYHVQGAFYCDGVYYATEKYPKGFVFIAVEKEPPYAVACYYLDEMGMEAGHNAYMNDIRVFAECKQTNKWPGYGENVTPLILPKYLFNRIG